LIAASSIFARFFSASSTRPCVINQRGLSGSVRPTKMTTRASTGPVRNARRQPTFAENALRKISEANEPMIAPAQ
jgi:hypothetical protein